MVDVKLRLTHHWFRLKAYFLNNLISGSGEVVFKPKIQCKNKTFLFDLYLYSSNHDQELIICNNGWTMGVIKIEINFEFKNTLCSQHDFKYLTAHPCTEIYTTAFVRSRRLQRCVGRYCRSRMSRAMMLGS